MAYRNRVYVAFDADSDIRYFNLMKAWKQHDGVSFSFNDAHELKQARDSSTEETIKRSLAERLANSKVFILLVGESTKYLYKFVRWEMEQALRRGLPIVCVNLNGRRSQDSASCPPILKEELAMHISFGANILEHTLENWPSQYVELKAAQKSGPYYYKDEIYDRIGG